MQIKEPLRFMGNPLRPPYFRRLFMSGHIIIPYYKPLSRCVQMRIAPKTHSKKGGEDGIRKWLARNLNRIKYETELRLGATTRDH